MAIKAVYFDFDGVLTPHKNDGYTTCKNLSESTGISFSKLYEAYSPFLERLYAGKITNRELWTNFCEALNTNIDIKLLELALKNTPQNKPMLAIARKIRAKGLRVGIVTNQAVDRYELIKKDFELESIFNPIVVSAAVGCTKRGEFGGNKIFEEALKPHDLKSEECVFIDNSKSNLIIPKEMGFHVYYFDETKNDTGSFKQWLNKLGVQMN